MRNAYGKRVPDVICPNLKVLFVGINPGLYSAATGHHFARPGNRFWPTLRAAGFTPKLLSPFDDREMLDHGYGITNIVDRATARADELAPDEFVAGAHILRRKVRRYRPQVVAVVGVGAYRLAFQRPVARLGLQDEPIEGATLWVLPNTSGLNANYQAAQLKRLFAELRRAVNRSG
jgi:TDG/mug DNA glycosylase family protein